MGAEDPLVQSLEKLHIDHDFVLDPEHRPKRRYDDYSASGDKVPIIDLTPLREKSSSSANDSALQNIVEQVGSACKDWGFFQVINHGVPLHLLDALEANAQEFFHLPLEEKRRVRARVIHFSSVLYHGRFLVCKLYSVLDAIKCMMASVLQKVESSHSWSSVHQSRWANDKIAHCFNVGDSSESENLAGAADIWECVGLLWHGVDQECKGLEGGVRFCAAWNFGASCGLCQRREKNQHCRESVAIYTIYTQARPQFPFTMILLYRLSNW